MFVCVPIAESSELVICISDKNPLSDPWFSFIFLLVPSLPFYSLNDAWGGGGSKLSGKQISSVYQFFLSPKYAFSVLSKNPLFNSWSQRFPPMCSSKSFTFRSL